jgi:hypothetical protein
VGETVEQGRGHLGIAKNGGPLAEAEVRGDHDTGAFIEFAQQVEQECAFHGTWASIPRERGRLFHASGSLADGDMGSGLTGLVKGFGDGGVSSHAFSSELEAVGAVNEPVENGVGERWVADCLVPVLDRQLAGHDG